MTLITSLEAIPLIEQPCGLSIGTFDGVHLGHQALLRYLKVHLPAPAPLIAFTFANHPSTLFSPHSPTSLIYPKKKRAELLFSCGADYVIMPPFTKALAELSYEEFLDLLREKFPRFHLVLGEGATFGKGREGNESRVKESAQKKNFTVEYLPKTLFGPQPISSGRIRIAIKSGYFEEASSCLGRPYGLYGRVVDEKEGLLFVVNQEICLPPEGIYPQRSKLIPLLSLSAYTLPLSVVA